VEQLRSLLRQVLGTTNKALSAWTVSQNLITRVTKLTSNRFDQIDRLINLSRLSVIEENKQMQNLKMESYTAQRLLSVVTEQVGKIITRLQETECLYLALKNISVGRLSHHLIKTEILQNHLNILGETIKKHNPKAKIIYSFVYYYYTAEKVASAINKYMDENTLIVIVNVPLTADDLIAPINIWEVYTFLLLSPDEGEYYTELTSVSKFIIHNSANKYYAVANDRQILPCTEYQRFGCLFKTPNLNLNLHSILDNSCAMALFDYDLNAIKKHCVYHVIFGLLEPTVYQISSDKLFMVNISSITVYRESRFPSKSETLLKPISNISLEIFTNASQNINTMPCKAKVNVLNNTYLSQDFCDDFSLEAKMETNYPNNMVILRRFYSNHSLLNNVNAALEFDYTLKAVLLKLEVKKTEFEAI